MTIRIRRLALLLPVLAVGLSLELAAALHAQTAPAPALAGRVSSAAEGPMEGVLVTARKPGSNVAVTVVSDARGQYRFPVSHLAPGTYGLSIRAIGYDLAPRRPSRSPRKRRTTICGWCRPAISKTRSPTANG